MVIANAVHETAIADGDIFPSPKGRDLADCAGPIVLAFVQKAKLDTRAGGDTELRAGHRAHTHPRRLRADRGRGHCAAGAPRQRGRPGPAAYRVCRGGNGGRCDRTLLQQGTRKGLGLRGGSFTFHPMTTGYHFDLDALHWTTDLGVSGAIEWNQDTGAITSRISLSGAAQGDLVIAWNNQQRLAAATLTGRVDNTRVAATRIAPLSVA